jgi:hypothetical protein
MMESSVAISGARSGRRRLAGKVAFTNIGSSRIDFNRCRRRLTNNS